MKRLLIPVSLIGCMSATACPICNSPTGKAIRAELLSRNLPRDLLISLFPFIIFTIIGWMIYKRSAGSNNNNKRNGLAAAGFFAGVGLGGFLDGIIFHQVLQTHSMFSAELPQTNLVNVKTSMVWDGLFHLLTWTFTIIGFVLLWNTAAAKQEPMQGKRLWSNVLFGWGLFNAIEAICNHYVFNIHHVVEDLGLSVYDHAYFLSGILFLVVAAYSKKRPSLERDHP